MGRRAPLRTSLRAPHALSSRKRARDFDVRWTRLYEKIGVRLLLLYKPLDPFKGAASRHTRAPFCFLAQGVLEAPKSLGPAQMADQIVQYVGFTAGASVREYNFVVREEGRPREYTVTIANEAFVSHRARYQDGPTICSLRLRRELAVNPNDPATTQFCITDSELADYKKDNSPKAVNYLQKRDRD